NLLNVAGLHVQHGAQPAGQRLEEPDMHDRRGQVDMTHALAAHAAVRHLHAAAIADDSFVFGPLVLAAGTLPIALGAKDALAEEPILFSAIRAVVDGLRLLYLTKRPGPNIIRAGQLNPNRTIIVDAIVNGFSHLRSSLSSQLFLDF